MASLAQVPLRKALELTIKGPGVYETRFPHSTCFGSMTFGGLILSFVQAAASDHFSKITKDAPQTHVRSLAVSFLRPNFPDPESSELLIEPVNLGRAWSTAHVKLMQRGKTCMVGYITMTNLALKADISCDTNWSLSPPPPSVTISALLRDQDPNWVGFSTQYSSTSFRRCQSYMHAFVPLTLQDPSFMDQWVTPGWTDPEIAGGAVWTNDTIHFVTDNSLPILDNCLPQGQASGTHTAIVAEGHAQKQARETGLQFQGKEQPYTTPVMITTLSLQTEVKKRLPESGVKWLFMRARAKKIYENRMDMEVVLLDEAEDLIAITNQILQVVRVGQGKIRKSSL